MTTSHNVGNLAADMTKGYRSLALRGTLCPCLATRRLPAATQNRLGCLAMALPWRDSGSAPRSETRSQSTDVLSPTSQKSSSLEPPPSLPPTADAPRHQGSPSQPRAARGNDKDTVLTFAYGANLNFLTLARREVNVLSRDPAFIPDPSVRLVFKHQGGYATLERHPVDQSARSSSNGSSAGAGTGLAQPPEAAAAEGAGAGAGSPRSSSNGSNGGAGGGDLRSTTGTPGQDSMQRSSYSADEPPRFVPYDGHVHGVVYRVTKEDFAKLAKREGGYVVEEIEVQTYDGRRCRALAFVSNPLFKLPAEVTPTEGYLSRVREGAADNYLDPAYQAFLSGISTVPGTGLGSEYFNTPSKYMGYSFLLVCALITAAFFVQH